MLKWGDATQQENGLSMQCTMCVCVCANQHNTNVLKGRMNSEQNKGMQYSPGEEVAHSHYFHAGKHSGLVEEDRQLLCSDN